jgi:RNA polymerase sigma-70 factor (ECF subfamily)
MGASPEPRARHEQPDPERGTTELAAETLERIYRDHFVFVWRTLRALGVPRPMLDDAVQEVFLIAHRRGDAFEGRSSIKTWLFGIAVRLAANVRRAAKRRPATDPLPPSLQTDTPNPEQRAARAEATRFVEQVLAELDDGPREAFIACVLEEMSAPEAARALGVNVNTVSSRLRLARARFAAALAKRSLLP